MQNRRFAKQIYLKNQNPSSTTFDIKLKYKQQKGKQFDGKFVKSTKSLVNIDTMESEIKNNTRNGALVQKGCKLIR